jgi:hypothetical protein
MKWYAGQNLPVTHARPTFSEAWFHQNYGLTFGEKYHREPVFRTEQDQEALRLLFGRFGYAGIGERDPRPRPHLEICGHRFMPALFGCEIIYQIDQAPSSQHLSIGSAADIAAILRPELATNRWAREFLRQAHQLSNHYGGVDATINHGGPINVALSVLGSEALTYLVEDREVMGRFLDTITETIIESYDKLTVAFNPELGGGRHMFIGNCPVVMLSARTYRETVLPADLRFRRQVEKFGLHHCGKMDLYVGDYRELGPLDYIEVGWGSDLALVRRAFPDAVMDLMINICDLQTMSRATMREVITEMVLKAAPVSLIRDIWVADIGPDVPDETILNFVEAVNGAMFSARE